MSAIWGMINFNGMEVREDLAERMEEPYHKYKIDSFGRYMAGNKLIGYGGQYFTKEAVYEQQPIVGDQGDIFVADAVLDNREELFAKLDIPPENQDKIPDGSLMYQIRRNYGSQSYDLFLGTYAFVYYDKENDTITLVSDPTGSRCLYYSYIDNVLCFSTLMKPIIHILGDKASWNYRFLSDYLALDNLSLYTNAKETSREHIFKVEPSQILTFGRQGMSDKKYWKLSLNNKHRDKSDEDYKKEFIELFRTCNSCVLRSSNKTGILLSGGLDSTSVACFTAPMLRERQELLYSYTSIPEHENVQKRNTYYVVNEQKAVERTGDFLGNLSCSFLELPGVNGFDGATEHMNKLEVPYKALQNIKWLHACADKAAKDGCRILLSGGFGNSTISFGKYEKQFYSLIRKGQFLELVKEVNAYAEKYHVGRRKIYSYILRIVKSSLANRSLRAADLFHNVYVNQDLACRYETKKRFQNRERRMLKSQTPAGRIKNPISIYSVVFSQIGEFQTHLSLDTGVLLRDPTKDKRMIEFCFQLPDNQFVYRGTERRLVREYLKEFLPPEIIADTRHRGLQSADILVRIADNWNSIYKECDCLLKEDLAADILHLPKARQKLASFKDELPPGDEREIVKLLYSILLVKYIKEEEFFQNC